MKRLLFTIIAIVSIATCYSQEYKYKAMYIYNFTKQIEWPAADRTGEFVIYVVNQNELFNQLSAIVAGKKVGTQDIVVKKVKTIDEVTKCHIVFLASSVSGNANMEAITAKLNGTSSLILTERPGTLKNGSCINFLIRDEKLKFEMNSSALSQKKLQVSSGLLSMAVAN